MIIEFIIFNIKNIDLMSSGILKTHFCLIAFKLTQIKPQSISSVFSKSK